MKKTDGTEKLFKCPDCQKPFRFKYELQKHLVVHTGEKPFKCKICSQPFASTEGLRRHEKEVHSNKNRRPFECKKCGAAFKRGAHLRSHDHRVHPLKPLEKPNKCENCSMRFLNESELTVHRRVHSEDRLPCHICPKSFKHKWALRDHVLSSHSDELSLECKLCHKRLCSKSSLATHMRIHTAEKPYKCDECINFKKCFRSTSELKRHKINHHSERVVLLCNFCPNQYRSAFGLKLHLDTEHGKEYPEKKFPCDICDKSFMRANTLREHKKTHEKIKGLKCYFCLRAFNTMTALKSHVGRTHTREKYFKCYFCSKAFFCNPDLNRHMMSIHTNEKMFQCIFCFKFYAVFSSLSFHIKSHLKERPYR